jgi:hypothetical protein
MGAPVMIRAHVPAASSNPRLSPAATSAATGNITGEAAVAATTSAALTAYPSMAERPRLKAATPAPRPAAGHGV